MIWVWWIAVPVGFVSCALFEPRRIQESGESGKCGEIAIADGTKQGVLVWKPSAAWR